MEPSRRFGLSACHRGPLIWSLLFPELTLRSVRSYPSDLCAGVLIAAPTGINGRTEHARVLQPLALSLFGTARVGLCLFGLGESGLGETRKLLRDDCTIRQGRGDHFAGDRPLFFAPIPGVVARCHLEHYRYVIFRLAPGNSY